MTVQNRRDVRKNKVQSPAWVRASISFPAEVHRRLEELARDKKVSLAWVVRDAADKYLAAQKSVAIEK